MKFGTLQVYPRQGLLVEHGLELPTAVIGRGEGSNIHIDDFSVSRRHARITVDSGRLLVEDLNSVGGTFVDGERVEPGIRHLVDEGSVLRFGEIEAHFLPPPPAEVNVAPGATTSEELPNTSLHLLLASPTLPIDLGRPATATLVVTSRGRIVDNVRVEVADLPADWVTIESRAFPILPRGRAEVPIRIHPPRRHQSLAGEYTFTVVVHSQFSDEPVQVQGSFDVQPFEAAALSLEALRSKRKFRLVAENTGNSAARYELEGRDEEQAFHYLFESPVIELEPGEKRILPFTVRHRRQWFGSPTQPPFEIIGKSATGAEITARGQLAIAPPLQRFRMPVMFALVAMVLLATAVAVLILTDGSGTKTASAEDPYAGVHLCSDDKAQEAQAQKNIDAANDKAPTTAKVVGPYDGGRAVFGQVDSNGAPFFAQSDPRWGAQEYARSTELPNGKDWCGTTIEQCGCAMTSVSVMLALYDMLQMPDGTPLSPKALNDWFNGAARKTDRGWVSRGYIYGDVIWTAANELSGEIAKAYPGTTTVRFVRTGSGSEDEIRGELKAGRPIILEVPGHWIAAVGIDESDDSILINDPFYRDRRTLDAYKGKVRSSVLYEPSSDLSSVVITAPSNVRFRITDKQGRVVNTGSGTIAQPTDEINQIPGASVAHRAAWRDPTCIEKAPPPDAGTNQVVLPGSRDDYVVEILDTGGDTGSVAIHTYGKDGQSSIATIEGAEGTKADVAYDPNADKPVINISGTATPQATVTPAGGAAGGDDETPTPAPTPPPASPTATPFVEQRTAMTLPAEPGQTRVEVATNSGFELGDPIRFAPGLPNEEDNIIVGFGSFILASPLKFAHSPGEPISRLPRPPGQGPGLPPGITPPPATGPLEPPESVVMQCSTIYQASPKLATLICDLQIEGRFTTTRWTLNGQVVSEFSGSQSLVMTFPGDTPANISATVCNVTLCRSTSKNENLEFPPASGGSGTSSPTGGGAAVAPTPPPAGQVTITCGTTFDQNKVPAVANISCQANFAGDFTTVSWSAPGGTPSNASGAKKEFQTQLINDLGVPTTLKITATVCNFGVCRTSQPFTVGVGQTKTIIDSEPQGSVHQRHTVTLFAAVVGLNGIVPQGGNVQFYADDSPINPSAALFTVGSTSVAQIAVPTGSAAGLTNVGTHSIYAVYSGGINAFGSTSLPANLEVLPPLPDSCDSVDEDGNGTIDDFTSGSGDTSCDISVPRNLGAGTVVDAITISTGSAADQDGAPNAVVVTPGKPLSITGSVSRTDYCPGCIRQVYLGIAGYDTQSPPTKIGPHCVHTGGTLVTPIGFNLGGWNVTAPTTPGVYYIRATTTLDYFCVGPAVGPPDKSVGRIIVKGPVVADIKLYQASSTTDNNPWDDAVSTPVTTVEAGKKLIVVASVPPGATGRVDISGVGGSALSAPVCPSSGQLLIPSIQATPIACTPGEARVMSPIINDDAPSMAVRGRYVNPFPAQLPAPPSGNVIAYPFFESPEQLPYPANPWVGSNIVTVKILVNANVQIAASPNPVVMGQPFTLTATVTSANTALGLFGTGGTVQFLAGTNPVGSPVPVDATGHASITWTPRTCSGAPPAGTCSAANQGFPFDSQDQRSVPDAYQDVHAVFSSGTSDLKDGTSGNVDVDIDPAPSATAITAVSVSAPDLGDPFTITATVTATEFTPVPGILTFRAGTSTLATHTLVAGDCTLSTNVYTCTFTTPSIATGGDSDVIDSAGTYSLTAVFSGSSQLDTSTSAPFSLTFALAPVTVMVSLPNSGTITVGDTDPPGAVNDVRAVVSGTPANRLDDSPAQLIYRDGSTVLDTDSIGSVTGGQGSEMEVSTLNAGTYTITVEYTGNAYFGTTTVGPYTLTVNKFDPTIALNIVGGTTHLVGDNLVLGATLQCGGAGCSGVRSASGGSVSFYYGTTLLGTDSNLGDGISVTVPTGDGQTLSTAGTAYGNLTATFNGDASNGNLNSATSSAGSVTLTKRNSNATVATGSTAVTGSNITLNATVAATSAPTTAVSVACNGCLQFEVNTGTTTPVWSAVGAPVNVASDGSATIVQATGSGAPFFPNSQTYSIRAVYAGNANYNSDTSSAVNATVTPPSPTVTVTGTTVQYGVLGNVLAVVTGPSGEDASCNSCMEFRVGSSFASGTPLATGSVALVSGEYRASISFTPGSTPLANAGTYTLWTRYLGKSGVLAAATSATSDDIVVTARTVTVTVTAPASVTLGGSSITLTATLSPTSAPGTVAFFADGVAIPGAGSRTVSSGVATFNWSPSSIGDGTATISAQYTSSSGNYASQSTSTNDDVTINPAASTIVATGAQSGAAGTTVTLTANVTSSFPSAGTNVSGGTVTWTITHSNGANTCSGPGGAALTAPVVNGVATLTGVTCTVANNYNVRGSFSGSGNYAASSDNTDADLDVS